MGRIEPGIDQKRKHRFRGRAGKLWTERFSQFVGWHRSGLCQERFDSRIRLRHLRKCGAHEVGNTFEYIDLSNIRTAGVVNGNMPNWFRQVSANIGVPVFINKGRGSLLVTDGEFTDGSSKTTAIRAPANSAGGVMFLRNITTSGYAAALATGAANTVVRGADISDMRIRRRHRCFPVR